MSAFFETSRDTSSERAIMRSLSCSRSVRGMGTCWAVCSSGVASSSGSITSTLLRLDSHRFASSAAEASRSAAARINFEGAFHRTDIGWREERRTEQTELQEDDAT